MTRKTDTQYWQLIAKGIEWENNKLQHFVKHSPSLGAGRESILRSILIAQTPEPYRVKTGFVVHYADNNIVTSDQCDILAYDPTVSQPMYSIDEFVVVPYQAVRIAIEVRSILSVGEKKDKKTISGLDQMFKVCKSMKKPRTPVFGFAYAGVKFDAFVSAIAKRVNGNIFSVPECIVVHEHNYICLRVTERQAKTNPPPPETRLCIAMDFSKCKGETAGLATAYFLSLYEEKVRPSIGSTDGFALQRVGFLARHHQIPDSAIRMIDENGQITHGPIPS